ncbi:MAG: hypothetical protein AB7G11_13565 [Phycisphaerales bacterium]
MRNTIRACLLVIALALAARIAVAQTPQVDRGMPGTAFAALSFQEAREEAFKKKRLLMVYLYDPKDPDTAEIERRTWRNPTLAAYCLWHCVTVRYTPGDPSYSAARRCTVGRAHGLKHHAGKMPAVYLWRDAVRPTNTNCPDLLFSAGTQSLGPIPDFGLMGGGHDVQGIPPTPIFVLLQADITLEGLASIEPVWRALHDQLNPIPEPPGPADPLYQTEDDGAKAIVESDLVLRHDHREVEHGGVVIDVLAQLRLAREAASNGDALRAAGLYTWLWERGEYFDASFRAARRSMLTQEIRDLIAKHPRTRGRFERVRAAVTERLRWAERDELTEWFLLNGVLGDEIETLSFLDLSINDQDEGSMLPRAMWHGYRLMMLRDMWTDPWVPSRVRPGPDRSVRTTVDATGVLKHLETIRRSIRGPRPLSSPSDEWEAFRTFAKQFLLDESCRLHAACLKGGDEATAWLIADAMIADRDDASVRQALITTALAAEEARPRHLQLLEQAERLGGTHPTLRDELLKALPAAATPPHTK